MKKSALVFVFAIGACSPAEEPIQTERGVAVQALRAASDLNSAFVSFDFLATDANGNAIDCDDENLSVDIEVSFDDGATYVQASNNDVSISCGQNTGPQVALVLDNSGSQETVLDTTKQAAHAYTEEILNAGGRVSLTRVSTQSNVLTELTEDSGVLSPAIDSMFVNRGWTALYDGIRIGNETLGQELSGTTAISYTDSASFCNDAPETAIVLFTNGEDNNSADQELAEDSDGIDTTLEDLIGLRVESSLTPIYSIGLGPRVDHGNLTQLTSSTGGRHLEIQDISSLPTAFELFTGYPQATARVCGEMTASGCGDSKVRISYDYVTDEGTFQGSTEYDVYIPCPIGEPQGKTASIILTMSNPGVNIDDARQLAGNAVNWVSDSPSPKVLVVKDDHHHNEDAGDARYVYDLLDVAGFDVTFFEEPKEGTRPDDLTGYDVVWYTNPGWPMDEKASFDALKEFSAQGHGVVFQGDDMTWSKGKGFPMTEMTHLTHIKNGTKTCGKRTDNNAGEDYEVTIAGGGHPIIAGLEGKTFLYGNDIDHSAPAGDGEQVLATATLAGDPNCALSTPVIVAYEP